MFQILKTTAKILTTGVLVLALFVCALGELLNPNSSILSMGLTWFAAFNIGALISATWV